MRLLISKECDMETASGACGDGNATQKTRPFSWAAGRNRLVRFFRAERSGQLDDPFPRRFRPLTLNELGHLVLQHLLSLAAFFGFRPPHFVADAFGTFLRALLQSPSAQPGLLLKEEAQQNPV